MFSIKFTLRQHTPVIHFQADARDATLRATELKPKLDRFLCKKRGDNFDDCRPLVVGASLDKKREDDLRKRWKEENYRALDYTVRVKTTGQNPKIIGKKDKVPTFFANLGDDYEQSPKFKSTAQTELIFTSPHDELLKLIPQHLDEFFWHHNFGTRQSKGWGSFTIESADCDFSRYAPEGFFQFSIPKTDPFETINLFYRLLRAGLNGVFLKKNHATGRLELDKRTHYCKPVIFEFASFKRELGRPKELVLQWEKKTIKQELIYNGRTAIDNQVQEHNLLNVADHPLKVNSNSKKAIKDLMGFSTVEEWGSYGRTSISKTHSDSDIRRMKSPMFFKPIKNETGFQIYFRFDEVPKEFYENASIEFSTGRGRPLTIPVLKPNDDFFENMIRFAANDIDWNTFFQVNQNYGAAAAAEGQAVKNEIIRIFIEIRTHIQAIQP
jgi:hypothetical protein